jgi:hypothetical protein
MSKGKRGPAPFGSAAFLLGILQKPWTSENEVGATPLSPRSGSRITVCRTQLY